MERQGGELGRVGEAGVRGKENRVGILLGTRASVLCRGRWLFELCSTALATDGVQVYSHRLQDQLHPLGLRIITHSANQIEKHL